MKKTLILAAAAVLGAATFAFAGNGKTVKGSGKLVTRTLPAPAFDAVHAFRSVTVKLVAGDPGDQIVIEADDNLIDHVFVSKENGALVVSIDARIEAEHPHITVTVPTNGKINLIRSFDSSNIQCEVPLVNDLVTFEASSSGYITAAVNAGECRITAGSSAGVRADIKANRCNLKASSSGEITAAIAFKICEVQFGMSAHLTLSGLAVECVAQCSSSANYQAAEFDVKAYDIKVGSSAHAEIQCSERLTAYSISSSSIGYTGDCAVDAHVGSNGIIQKR